MQRCRGAKAGALAGALVVLGACGQVPSDGVRPVFALSGPGQEVDLENPMARGKAYFRAAQYGLALKAFRQALSGAEGADRVRALNAVAAAYDKLGRFDLSDRYYKSALELEPRSVAVLNNFGYSHFLRGDKARARQLYDLALAVERDNETVRTNLAVAKLWKPKAGEAAPDHGLARAAPGGEAEGAATTPAADEGPSRKQRIVRTGDVTYALVTEPREDVAVGGRPAAAGAGLGATRTTGHAPPRVAVSTGERRIFPVRRGVYELRTRPGSGTRGTATGATGRERSQPKGEPRDDGQAKALSRKKFLLRSGRWSVEVSNGAGRLAMAARMSEYLSQRGIEVSRLTNADSFANFISAIYYRPGARAAARALAAELPARIALRRDPHAQVDVRLVLGGDLLDFDRTLIAVLSDTNLDA